MSNGNQTPKKEITKKKLRLIENALVVRQLKPIFSGDELLPTMSALGGTGHASGKEAFRF